MEREEQFQNNNMWRYATPCRPVNGCKMNDLEWPWAAISWQNAFSVSISWIRAFECQTLYNLCDSAVFCALHDQLASLGWHAHLTRCFSAVAELLVKTQYTFCDDCNLTAMKGKAVEQLLSLDNPVMSSYAFYAVLLLLKVFAITVMTGYKRIAKKVISLCINNFILWHRLYQLYINYCVEFEIILILIWVWCWHNIDKITLQWQWNKFAANAWLMEETCYLPMNTDINIT